MLENNHIIFFDGLCNLCSSSVQFIIKQDKNAKFLFASNQSNYAQKRLHEFFDEKMIANTQSILLIKNNKLYQKSTAVIEICKTLKGIWMIATVGYLIPKIIRDKLYDWVAKNRYQWFGKRTDCWLPTPELNERFLD